eukprot:GILI01005588.1.p1 GENE.GILI01005588.1~~GILI01005588.1.p1  ORF type:complete len:442 (+),score=133.29 GILI01005588.1:55-1380(+)
MDSSSLFDGLQIDDDYSHLSLDTTEPSMFYSMSCKQPSFDQLTEIDNMFAFRSNTSSSSQSSSLPASSYTPSSNYPYYSPPSMYGDIQEQELRAQIQQLQNQNAYAAASYSVELTPSSMPPASNPMSQYLYYQPVLVGPNGQQVQLPMSVPTPVSVMPIPMPMMVKTEVAEPLLHMAAQPPSEVRTRTPNELRVFSAAVSISGSFVEAGVAGVAVRLLYAHSSPSSSSTLPSEPCQDILGGPRFVAVNMGVCVARFEGLSMSESSSKHQEREFALEFIAVDCLGQPLSSVKSCVSSPFYSYSHQNVLKRRKAVSLHSVCLASARRAASCSCAPSSSSSCSCCSVRCHVIGKGFIDGPALAVVMKSAHGEVRAANLEFFSDSVLFFDLPAYPVAGLMQDVDVSFTVTNDGRTFCPPISVVYPAPAVDPQALLDPEQVLRSRI